MADFPWVTVLAIFGIAVPAFAFVWEFLVIGRKRLGYRIQMDTTAFDKVPSNTEGDWERLLKQANGERLSDPSFVLLRIYNRGTTNITEDDYAVLREDKVGIRVHFPDRRVVAMAVAEISEGLPPGNFKENSGLRSVSR